MAKERQFVLNKRGEKVAVVLSIEEYEELLEEIEDLQAVREYEKTKASGETPIPLEQALTEIRRNRK
jgi:PHD/YefM family antitoxin component YafN of YafNO toxin-antitoxin module